MTYAAVCVFRERVRCGTPSSIAILSCALLLIAACGSTDQGSSAAADAEPSPTVLAASSGEKIVNVYKWFDYIDPAMLERFTAETGIRVVYDTYDANEVLETKLLAGNTGYDGKLPLERCIRPCPRRLLRMSACRGSYSTVLNHG